jgi:hypothetical protein
MEEIERTRMKDTKKDKDKDEGEKREDFRGSPEYDNCCSIEVNISFSSSLSLSLSRFTPNKFCTGITVSECSAHVPDR